MVCSLSPRGGEVHPVHPDPILVLIRIESTPYSPGLLALHKRKARRNVDE
jgi:hypothetical protein